MKCVPCLNGMPEFCMGGDCEVSKREGLDSGSEIRTGEMDSNDNEEDYKRQPKRHRKRTATLKDPSSTGRKEAARLYPLNPDADCEWAHKERAGGGQFPIKGCGSTRPVGKQENRHHGPDKNTMNNEEGNVHRICSSCHNLWHAKNDESRQSGRKSKSD